MYQCHHHQYQTDYYHYHHSSSFTTYHHTMSILTVMGRDGVDNRIEEKGRLVRIVTLHIGRSRVVIEGNRHKSGTVVVHIWIGNTPFRTNWNTNDDFVHIIKLIPIFILFLHGECKYNENRKRYVRYLDPEVRISVHREWLD